MIKFKNHILIGFGFLFIASFLGLLLRYFPISDFEFNFRNIVHTHSHIAVMGWIYFGIITLIAYYFLKPDIPPKIYNFSVYFSFVSVAGMLCSFPFQGYAFFSILFSSLFLISGYFYCWLFFKYTPNVLQKQSASYKIIKYALIYSIISSIGPWSIGVVMATLGPDPFWYNTTIYFYLHFQYNAWIILGIIGVFIRILENNNIKINERTSKYFIITFNIGAILTFFISILFSKPAHEFYVLAIMGAIMQLIAYFIFYDLIKDHLKTVKTIFNKAVYQLLKWAFILFFIKNVMQFLGSFPYFADLVFVNHYLAIGFLHWIFLGIATMSLFALLNKTTLFKINTFANYLYLSGFIITEFIIFYLPVSKILNLPKIQSYNYNWVLFIASMFLVLSIAYIFTLQINYKNKIKK